MADTTIRLRYPTGATLYTQIEGGAGVWNGSTYGTFSNGSWSSYATATPETPSGSGRYVCQFPTGSPAGNYSWSVYLRAGASPAVGDVCIGSGSGYYDGSTFGGSSSVTGDVGGNVAGSVDSVTSSVTLPTVPPTGYGGATILHAGTAQAGAATTITLDSGAGSVDGQYVFCTLAIVEGTGAGQANVISAYNGTNKVATVTNPWATVPDATSQFQILPQGAVIVGQIAGGARTVTQDWQGTEGLTVINETTGQPIQGATVKAYLATAFATSGTAAPVIAETTTDASGHWSLSLSPSNYTVVFGYGVETKSTIITVN